MLSLTTRFSEEAIRSFRQISVTIGVTVQQVLQQTVGLRQQATSMVKFAEPLANGSVRSLWDIEGCGAHGGVLRHTMHGARMPSRVVDGRHPLKYVSRNRAPKICAQEPREVPAGTFRN